MIFKLIQDKSLAAEVTQNIFDEEGCLLPLTPRVQEAWSRRAIRNRRGKIVNPRLN